MVNREVNVFMGELLVATVVGTDFEVVLKDHAASKQEQP